MCAEPDARVHLGTHSGVIRPLDPSGAPKVAAMITMTPRGPFSLAASTRFLEGFAPAGYEGRGEHLHLAFLVERDWRTVGICLQKDGGDVVAEVFGEADPQRVEAQVARILSLDVDGRGFPAIGERDPVVADLQRSYPGLRPVTFWSPYEAAAWTVLSHRVRITQAAALKQRVAEHLGETVEVHGERITAFPSPARLHELRTLKGVNERKVAYLHGIADAAEDGTLDAERLRELPRAEALAQLRGLPGIGPFSADLVLLRGAGDPDGFPATEGRLHRAMSMRYGLDEPDQADLERIAEGWRPYRTWVSVLFRVWLEDQGGGGVTTAS